MYFFGNEFRAQLDAGGITPVHVTGGTSVDLRSAILEVKTLAGFSGMPGDTYDIIWSATGFLTTDLLLSDLSGEADFEWGIVDKDGRKMLQLTVLGSPLEMWVQSLSLGWAATRPTPPTGEFPLSKHWKAGEGAIG